jgi:hypothetical protein
MKSLVKKPMNYTFLGALRVALDAQGAKVPHETGQPPGTGGKLDLFMLP